MAKQEKLTPEEKLKAQIKQLQRQIAIRDAMVLDRYPEPTPVDVDKALKASEITSRLGLPMISVWVSSVNGTVENITTTKDMDAFVYETERDALIALRNRTMTAAAVKCATLDRKIAKLQDERFVNTELATPYGATEQKPQPERQVGKHPALAAPYGTEQKPGLPGVDQLVAAIHNGTPPEEHDPLADEPGESQADPLAEDTEGGEGESQTVDPEPETTRAEVVSVATITGTMPVRPKKAASKKPAAKKQEPKKAAVKKPTKAPAKKAARRGR